MASQKPKQKSDSSPAAPNEKARVLEDLRTLTESLRALTGAVDKLHEEITRFLPKMSPAGADGGDVGRMGPSDRPGDASAASGDAPTASPREHPGEPPEGTAAGAPEEPDVDRLVEQQFQEIFGEGETLPKSDDRAAETAGTSTGRQASGLWLRLKQGKRILEVPLSWVQNASAEDFEQGEEIDRVHLEDETGEAEIPVDGVLGVVLSTQRSKSSEGVFRPQTVEDLVLLGPKPGLRTAPLASTSLAREAEVPDLDEIKRIFGDRSVVVASRSGIVRRFLRRHLETLGLDVVESDDPVESFPDGSFLGVFWDRSPNNRLSDLPNGFPVVCLSHQVEHSEVAPDSEAPLLAKPFSRQEVIQALLWMERRTSQGPRSDDAAGAGAKAASPSEAD